MKYDTWEKITLKSCIQKVIGGGTPSRTIPEYWGGSIPWMTVKDFATFSSKGTQEYITELGLKSSASHLIPAHVLIISTRMSVGSVVIYDVPVAINQDLKAISLSKKCLSNYLYHWFCKEKLKISKMGTGSTVKGIRLEQLLNLSINLPPPSEQTAIAEALSDTDSLISSLKKLIAKKKAIKQGAMQELLTGKKRLPGFSGKWKRKKIREILSVRHGRSQHSVERPYGKYPILATGGKIGYAAEYLYDKESVLIGRKGTIDRPQFINTPFWTVDTLFYTMIYDTFCAKFVYYRFCLINWMLYNEASGVPSLSSSTIENIDIEAPNYTEQTAIAQILSDMDAEIEQLEKKLSKYQQLKQGMMQELLTGRIRLVTIEPEQKQQAAPTKKHSQPFDDAVMIAGIVDAFYSDKYSLGRKKVQKLLYLMRRKEEADVSAFQKKAAGPYADAIRYKGGEPIAKKSNYVATETSAKGTRFSRGGKIEQALGYIQSWGKQGSVDWLVSNFQRTKVDDLELFATVDMAICDLRKMNKSVSLQTIKELIHSTKEWWAKLSKTFFSDQDIQRAINKCREFFGEQ